MTDAPFPDRIQQLRQRWDADPSSRLFLQLAEEYRHAGRLKEALGTLEAGLKEHPGYLSALVAKGRCLLELGQPEAAREVLERVVRQDATQMVASKLLVRAYLDLGDSGRARERLDLYGLLNEGDPELDELRRRIAEGEAPAPPVSPPAAPSPVGPEREEVVFDLEPPPADPFDIGPGPARRPAPAEDLFGIYPEPVRTPASIPPQAAAPGTAPELRFAVFEAGEAGEAGEEGEPEPEDGAIFPGLATRASRRLWAEHLAAEGIFVLEPPVPEPAGEVPAPIAPEPATATLGELYLRQGHLDEAESIFREVLEREPGSPAAREGLERLAAARPPARLPSETPQAAAPAPPADPRARKVLLLSAYLERIKRGSERHVP